MVAASNWPRGENEQFIFTLGNARPLDRKLPEVKFEGVAIGDVADFISEVTGAIVVVDWKGLDAAQKERALASGGEMRVGSNVGKGQMVTADFIVTPSVVFSENNAGGVGGGLGGLIGGRAGALRRRDGPVGGGGGRGAAAG